MTKRKLIPALAVAACATGGAAATTAALTDKGNNHNAAYTIKWPDALPSLSAPAGLADAINQVAENLRAQSPPAPAVVTHGEGGTYPVTYEAGYIARISGNTITLDDDGVKIDAVIPANAEITRDLTHVPLDDLAVGEHAVIIPNNRRTQVITFD